MLWMNTSDKIFIRYLKSAIQKTKSAIQKSTLKLFFFLKFILHL
jgi:hypothetical protein